VAARMHVDAMERCGYSVSVRVQNNNIQYLRLKDRCVGNEGRGEGWVSRLKRHAGKAGVKYTVSSNRTDCIPRISGNA